MIYRLDDLIESHDFEHDQKFVKAEHWKEACSEADENLKSANYLKERVKQLEQKLSDSEADWLKMREIAEETQRKLDEAVEVIKTLLEIHGEAEVNEPWELASARDFL